MRNRTRKFADLAVVATRPPRIIQPLQHMFDPIVEAAGPARRRSWRRWGGASVSVSRFSDFPTIAFDRFPPLPAGDVWQGVLHDLQLRLMAPSLHIRRSFPGLTFCAQPRCDAIDAPVTILPA